MSELLPAMRYDFNVVGGMAGPLDLFSQVDAQVLLLGGSKSPRYLKEALDALGHILRMRAGTNSTAWITRLPGTVTAAAIRGVSRQRSVTSSPGLHEAAWRLQIVAAPPPGLAIPCICCCLRARRLAPMRRM